MLDPPQDSDKHTHLTESLAILKDIFLNQKSATGPTAFNSYNPILLKGEL